MFQTTKKCIFFTFFCRKICICQKKVVPLHQILKLTLLTIKIITIMYGVKNFVNNTIIVYCETKEEAIAYAKNYNSSGIKKYQVVKIK